MTSPGLTSSVISSHVRVGDYALSGGSGGGGLYAEMDALLAGIPSLQGPLTVVNPLTNATKNNNHQLLTSPGGLSPTGDPPPSSHQSYTPSYLALDSLLSPTGDPPPSFYQSYIPSRLALVSLLSCRGVPLLSYHSYIPSHLALISLFLYRGELT